MITSAPEQQLVPMRIGSSEAQPPYHQIADAAGQAQGDGTVIHPEEVMPETEKSVFPGNIIPETMQKAGNPLPEFKTMFEETAGNVRGDESGVGVSHAADFRQTILRRIFRQHPGQKVTEQ